MKDWLRPPKFADETKTQQAFVLHVLLWALICVPIPYTILTILVLPEETTEVLTQFVVSESINIFLMVLLRRGRVALASRLQVAGFWLFFTMVALTGTGTTGPAYMLGYGAVIVIAGVLLSGLGALIMTVLSLLAGAVMLYGQSHGWIVPQQAAWISIWIPSLVIFPLIAVVQNLASSAVQRALRQARASEARYRNLLENIPAIAYINPIDPATPSEYVSPQVSELLGRSQQEFLSDPGIWTAVTHPDDRESVQAESKRAKAGGEPFGLDYRMTGKDGRVVWVRDDAVLVRGDGHVPPYWLGVLTDITARKRAEEERRRLEELYRGAIEAAGAVPYFRDFRTHAYTFMGEGIHEMTGYSAAEITPEIWQNVEKEGFPRGGLAHLSYQEADRLTEEGVIRRWECDYRILTRDGQTRWVSDSAIQVRDEDDERIGVIGILQDITDRKQTVEEIQRLNAELEQRVQERTLELQSANRELESFSYSVSHDLRTPLRSIRGFSDILLKDFGEQLDPAARSYLGKVITAAADMSQLIDGLLTLSRLSRSTVRRVPVDLTGLANDIMASFRRNEPDRRVTWSADGGLVAIADPALIRNVFENLLGNAWKYSSRSPNARIEFGAITLSSPEGVPNGHGGNSPFSFAAFSEKMRSEQRLAYYVRDNGVGFDMRYSDKLFGAFQRLHGAHEFPGHGIGLATVQKIIRRHGGEIWAESQPGRGATFYFTLGNQNAS